MDVEESNPENSEDVEIDDDDEEPITAKKVSKLFTFGCQSVRVSVESHSSSLLPFRYSIHCVRHG